VSVGYTRSLSDFSDLGVRFDLLYSRYATTSAQLGLQLRAPIRWVALRRDRVTLLAHVDPGFFVIPGAGAGDAHQSQLGVTITAGAALGVQVLPELRLALCADLPGYLQLLHGTSLILSPLFGFGVEYFPGDPALSIGLSVRFGPVFSTDPASTELGFVSQFSVGYRL
jgi:hypothetical protein